LKDFVLEAFRVLKPNGHLCIASFFASNENSISALKSMIETIPGGLDAAIPIEYFRDLLLGAGFKAVRVDPIGQNVWHGWDKWISQTEFKNTWNRNWYKSYKKKLLDYFLIVAKK
jgi:ubiquinone/menaquinone biosynthesis C-methylase UbiE